MFWDFKGISVALFSHVKADKVLLCVHLSTPMPCANCKRKLQFLRKATQIFLHHPALAPCVRAQTRLSRPGQAVCLLAGWASAACRWQQCPTSYSTVSCVILSPERFASESCMLISYRELKLPRTAEKLFLPNYCFSSTTVLHVKLPVLSPSIVLNSKCSQERCTLG